MEDQADNQPASNNRSKLVATIAVLLVAVLLVVGVKAFSGKSTADSNGAGNTTSSPADTTSTSDEESGSESTAAYKDGTYSATGDYDTPQSSEEIAIKVTLKDGKITDVEATTDPSANESREWQSRFLSGYKSLVVGKPIDDVKLSRVSGSSLTSNGFNEAIDNIKSQAKA